MHDHVSVSDSGQKIGNGISHDHVYTSFTNKLPTGFGYAGNLTFVSQFPEAYSAHAKLAHIGPGPAAYLTSVIFTNFIFGWPLLSNDHRFFGH
jgi:hypothetical protein